MEKRETPYETTWDEVKKVHSACISIITKALVSPPVIEKWALYAACLPAGSTPQGDPGHQDDHGTHGRQRLRSEGQRPVQKNDHEVPDSHWYEMSVLYEAPK